MNTDKLEKPDIPAALKEMGFVFSFKFIPYSESRNAGEWESLNWTVTVSHNRQAKPLVVEYSQGIGFLPKYIPVSSRRTINVDRAIKAAIETGELYNPNGSLTFPKGKVSPPSIAEVTYSLVSDGAADFDATSFEDWVSDYGYDPDSRKAEHTFNECRRIGAWIRGAVGTDGVDTLRTLFEDY